VGVCSCRFIKFSGPALDQYGNLKDASLLELDFSPNSLTAKAWLATSAFPVKEKPPKALTFSSEADDSDEHLPTPTPVQPSHTGN
jgi:hypothetical protein